MSLIVCKAERLYLLLLEVEGRIMSWWESIYYQTDGRYWLGTKHPFTFSRWNDTCLICSTHYNGIRWLMLKFITLRSVIGTSTFKCSHFYKWRENVCYTYLQPKISTQRGFSHAYSTTELSCINNCKCNKKCLHVFFPTV